MKTVNEIRLELRRTQLLKEETERRLLHLVETGIAAGLSWADIAQCLGTSRQNAHRKYSKLLPKNLRP